MATARPWPPVVRARAALERLVVGMGTSVPAVAASMWTLGTAVLCLTALTLASPAGGPTPLRVSLPCGS